jgi:hypothetical protein
MHRVSWVSIALVVLLAACGSVKTVSPSKLPKLVLQPADLPGPYTAFDVGHQTQLDRVPGPRSAPARFGRQGGWKARYNRPGSTATRGPLVVESRADVFKDATGAAKDLAAYRAQFARQPGGRPFAVRLGTAAAGVMQQRPGQPAVRLVSVAWQDGNVTASVTLNGFASGLRAADAVALARAQQRRIAGALGS